MKTTRRFQMSAPYWTILLFFCFGLAGCNYDSPGPEGFDFGYDDDDVAGDDGGDDLVPDDDLADDIGDDGADDNADDSSDDTGDDSGDDSADDDSAFPTPSPNPNAKADAFRLFYKERSERAVLSLNRFGLAGDAASANAFDKIFVAKTGNQYEVVPGPNDNNPIGMTAYAAWKLYHAIGGRPLELTLIRVFNGLAFNEEVSGHPGLTCREALPGWTRVMDGVNHTVSRTRSGLPFTPPVVYPDSLEREILDTFYDGLEITYREDPLDYYFHFKPINEDNAYSIVWVFSETLPAYLRISDCCSSWRITPPGYLWEGAYWGNHNSRDNFTDYAMGYLAAFEAEGTPGLPADVAEAAHNAAQAGRRTGDAIVNAGMILMTVDENSDYGTLTPAGHDRPDHHIEVEWQDLGSLASCAMVYAAQAVSTAGLDTPVPALPMPGDVISQGLDHIFYLLGLPPVAPVPNCTSIDDAILGLTWRDILDIQVFGMPWFDLAEILALVDPGIWVNLFGSAVDDFEEMILGAVALCEYAKVEHKDALYEESRRTLSNLIELTYHLTDLVYGAKSDPERWSQVKADLGADRAQTLASDSERLRYMVALYGRMFDIGTPLEDFLGFGLGDSRISDVEGFLAIPDTDPKPLMTDQQLYDAILDPQNGALANQKYQWTIDRYTSRFGDTVPVRRAGEGYEAIGPDGNWMPTENDRHRSFVPLLLWLEAPLCSTADPHTLDCSWARLGCAPADMDGSGSVDGADLALFESAWSNYGEGASCSDGNAWCGGADLDRNGILDADDQGYMNAAQGCVR